jgi:hypothetical protein
VDDAFGWSSIENRSTPQGPLVHDCPDLSQRVLDATRKRALGLPRTRFFQISAPEFNRALHDSVTMHIAGRRGPISRRR